VSSFTYIYKEEKRLARGEYYYGRLAVNHHDSICIRVSDYVRSDHQVSGTEDYGLDARSCRTVLPFSPFIGMPGTALATGIVYLVAMSSLDAIGIIMACWGSNNKYALIGGLRAAAQMISYELPLILALVGVVMQFAWLILIPVTLGNIVLTSVIYLVVSNLGLSNMAFLVVTAIINWALLFGFIRLVSRATVVSTRHAQAPA
jgi:NADH dehydrogenase